MVELTGRNALVTGASAGIGREIARVLAREVGGLILVARRRERLDELAAELKSAHPELHVMVRAVDLRDRGATGVLFDELEASGERVEILVNNAGFGDYAPLDQASWDKVEAMLELNVVSATYLLRRVLPGMIARKFGAVLNVGSSAGMVAQPGMAAYAASKAYLNHLSEGLRAELVGTGVSVTVVCPGPVPTEFQDVANLHARRAVPRALRVSAAVCAEESVAALKRGQARVIPGLPMRAVVLTLETMPRAFVRPMLRRVGRQLRR